MHTCPSHLRRAPFRSARRLHGKDTRAYRDTDSNASSAKNDDGDDLSVKSADDASVSPSAAAVDRDKKAFLQALERSIRTGQRIYPIEDDDVAGPTPSRFNPFTFITRFVNTRIRRRAAADDDDNNNES